jgi:ribosomal protein L40E
MLLAVLTGVYSTMVEPTLTNVVTSTWTATRWTESSIYTEKTSGYVWISMEVTTLRTMTTRFTTCSYKECRSDFTFYDSIELVELWEDAGASLVTWHNVCIRWKGSEVDSYYFPSRSCGTETNTFYSLSARTLTLTSTGSRTTLSRSLVEFPVTVTESHYETVPNPQKSNLQRLAVVLFIAGAGGLVLAIILRRPLVAQPSATFPPALSVPKPTPESHEVTERTITTEKKFCRYCGAMIPRVSRYCDECGKKLLYDR